MFYLWILLLYNVNKTNKQINYAFLTYNNIKIIEYWHRQTDIHTNTHTWELETLTNIIGHKTALYAFLADHSISLYILIKPIVNIWKPPFINDSYIIYIYGRLFAKKGINIKNLVTRNIFRFRLGLKVL